MRVVQNDSAHLDGLDLVVVFGSIARGDFREASDVDLIVDGPATTSFETMVRFRGSMTERLGRAVETLMLRDALDSPEVLVRAFEDGHVIRDRRSQWEALIRDRPRFEAGAQAVLRGYAGREAAALARLSKSAPAR